MKEMFQKISLKTWIIILLLLFPGIGLIIIANNLKDFWNAFLNSIGIAFLTSFATGILAEYVLRKDTLSIVYEVLKIKSSIENAKLSSIYIGLPNTDISNTIKNAKNIKIFHAYGDSWLKNHRIAVQEALKKGASISFYLYNYEYFNGKDLEKYYTTNKDKRTLKERIDKVVEDLKSLHDEANKGNLIIKLVPYLPYPSMYLYDNKAIIVIHPITYHYWQKTPVLEFVEGPVLESITEQFNVLEQAQEHVVTLYNENKKGASTKATKKKTDSQEKTNEASDDT